MDDKSFSHKYDSYLKAHLGKEEHSNVIQCCVL